MGNFSLIYATIDSAWTAAAVVAQRRFVETEGYVGHNSNVLRTLGCLNIMHDLKLLTTLGTVADADAQRRFVETGMRGKQQNCTALDGLF